MLQTFLPLLIMTFGICLFIVLMQFIWKYIDDMVGKGLEVAVLGEMLFYATLCLVPMALPLAILLAALMAFGNLGERLELLAMKASGVSLLRIMRPLIITLVLISIGAFYFQNNVMPVAQVKMYALLYSIRQKSPELDIPEGVFYKEITGYNVYVRQKDKSGLLKDLMIYNYSEGFEKANVMVADSGRLKMSEDKLFLILTLYSGESFENWEQNNNRREEAALYRRETFSTKDILIEFDANFTRTDDSFLQNMYVGKNLNDLQRSIDSMGIRLDSLKGLNVQNILGQSYQKLIRTTDPESPDERGATPIINPNVHAVNFDSLYRVESPDSKAAILGDIKRMIENTRSDYYFKAMSIADESYKLRRHNTEWHNKFTLSFSCLVFFFIGAPLGAIIRKGGLGVPVVLSVILFIFYYIINNIGFKMARDGVWMEWEGMWLSSAVLAPMGIFLTYKAVNDSVILNADTYINAIKNLFGKRSDRKVERKEVIIFAPDYVALVSLLRLLIEDCKVYLLTNKRWINYFSFWKKGGEDVHARHLSERIEMIVEELGNSDQNLILNKLMDYPIINGYNLLHLKNRPKTGIAIGIFFPLGLLVYFIAIYQRKLLLHDIKATERVSEELELMIQEFLSGQNN